MKNPLIKIKKEISRYKKRLFHSHPDYKIIDRLQYALENSPYEILQKLSDNQICLDIPIVRNSNETTDKILKDRCSLARFGDGEFSIMHDGNIHFQKSSQLLAQRLREVITSNVQGLLIGLPDCFGSLDSYHPQTADFWRKWMARKRTKIYSYIDMNRVYYSAFFTRVYMPYNKTDEHYRNCEEYFMKIKQIFTRRDVVICEGEGTRFGVLNDLLEGSKSISRILCPARSAFEKYAEILSAFNGIEKDRLILIALGPTATVLVHDLCKEGFQAIDVGHLDIEYEWFLRRDEEGRPIEFKYVDGSDAGRRVHRIENTEYQDQVIKTIL